MGEYELGLGLGIIALILFVGFAYLFFFKLVPRIFGAAFGLGGSLSPARLAQAGGWKKLAECWPTAAPPPERVLKRQWVQVGLVVYRRSVTIGASDDGLYLATSGVSNALGLNPVLVPWSAIAEVQKTRFQWTPAVRLKVGPPADTTIIFYTSVRDRLKMPLAVAVAK